MWGTGRAVGMLVLLATMTLSGCLTGGDDPVDTGSDIPEIGELNQEPVDDGPDIPPCTLTGGSIEWSQTDGAARPAAPTEVTLKTDAYGVTHIYADDAYSLFYANGYVQARDRLFQMDVLRLVGQGESARYLGPGQLASDYEVHRELYTTDEVEAQYAAAPAAGQEVLQAYADGVNRFIAEATADDALPSEFAAVGRTPPPWTPQDSVAVINYLIGFFGVAGGSEIANAHLLAGLESRLGEEAAWDAFGDYVWTRTDDTYTTISARDRAFNGCEDPLDGPTDAALQRATLDAAAGAVTFGTPDGGEPGVAGLADLLPSPPQEPYRYDPGKGLMEGFHWGSNALLVDGSHTETGAPIMWGAPQMSYFKPPIPYQVGLHGAGFEAAGMGVAGAPGIVIGRNADLAWSATSGIEDQVDLVQVDLVGQRSYAWDGEEVAMDCWTVEHQTAPAPADFAALPDVDPIPRVYTQEVCRGDGWPVVAINEDAGVAWLRTWTTRDEELMGALKWLDVATASSIDDFRETIADFPFTFNFHVASHDDVAFIHTGDIPLRAGGFDVRLPRPAGSTYDWRGEAYTGDMDVWATDPARGYFANWNNAPGWGWRAGDEGHLWGPVQRVQQIEYWMQQRMVETDGSFSWQDVADLNRLAATHDSLGLPFMPHLIEAAAMDPGLAAVRQALVDWTEAGLPWRDADGDGFYDDPAHAVWDIMMQDMIDRITGDELGGRTPVLDLDPKTHSDPHAADHGTLNTPLAPTLRALEGDTVHDWCDDVTTEARETCQQHLVAGLLAATSTLKAEYGDDVDDWLAPVHTTRFFPIGGAVADEMPMVNKGSWVQVVSMAESQRSGSASPPSNTGLLTAADLALLVGTGEEPDRLTAELDLYWNGQFKPFPLTTEEVDAEAVAEETLQVLPLAAPA